MVFHRATPASTPPDSPPLYGQRLNERKSERSLSRFSLPLILALSLFLLLSNLPFASQHYAVSQPASTVSQWLQPKERRERQAAQLQSTRLQHSEVLTEVVKWKDPDFALRHLRIYYYDLPTEFNSWLVEESHRNPPSIRDKYCDESFYSAEHTLSEFFRTASIRTMNASEADYFYVPILSTCYRMLNRPFDPEKNGAWFSRAMDHVIKNYPYWNRTDGRDHIFMFAQGAGARLAGDEWWKYRQATFLVHNGDYEESHFDVHKDLVIPPDLTHRVEPVWQSHGQVLNKKWFVQFGGQILNTKISDHRGSNYSGGVRQYISRELRDKEGYRITGVFTKSYEDDMRRSRFCLSPTGWHKWTPRPAYAVLSGCVPVILAEKQMLFFENLLKWQDVSVWIKPADVKLLNDKLREFPDVQVRRKLEEMRAVWPLLWWGEGGLAKEAVLYSLFRKLPAVRTGRIFL